MNFDKAVYFIWLTMACGVDNSHAFHVYSTFNSVEEVYKSHDFLSLRLPADVTANLCSKRIDDAYEVYKLCKSMGVGILCYDDALYPNRLRKIKSPPLVLYYKGELRNLEKEVCVAMVGTRKATPYGLGIAERLAEGMARHGATVVSGLADGIDAACHRGALKLNGYTVGVIGTGIDKIYPKCNATLYDALYKRGLVLSEYYPKCKTNKYSYPRRNRIISGLSNTVVVVEAGHRSGALITAKYAMEQGKKIFVPHVSIIPETEGVIALYREGADLISTAAEVLEEFDQLLPKPLDFREPKKPSRWYNPDDDGEEIPKEEQSPEYRRDKIQSFILEELKNRQSVTASELAAITREFSVSELLGAVTELEIDGDIRRTVGGRYELCF